MPNHRSYTDDQLRSIIVDAKCWSDVMEALGKARSASAKHVQQSVFRLGLDTSHFLHKARVPKTFSFPLPPQRRCKGHAGLSVAISWFMRHDYVALLPVEPALYDLVVETAEGFRKVQVKSSGRTANRGSRRSVRLTRRLYDSSVSANANGTYRMVPYEAHEVDYFFVIVGDGRMFLIPFSAVQGQSSIVPEDKFQDFLV